MNQTKKRLSIIKIAISITDIDSIQLQILKLGLLRTDEKIQEIIQVLQAENYAQAQGLITTYIETATEKILQRSSQKTEQALTKEEKETIDEFQLFVTPKENEDKIEIDINDYISNDIDINRFPSMIPINPNQKEKIPSIATDPYDSILNMDVDDVLSNNINIDTTHKKEENFFIFPSQEVKKVPSINLDIPKDTFFDLEEKTNSLETLTPMVIEKPIVENQDEALVKASLQESSSETILEEKKDVFKELVPSLTTNEIANPSSYKSISYIAQKLKSMSKQYPSPHNDESFPALSTLLSKISQETFTEEDIEKTLAEVKKLKEKEELSQAKQLLLVCAATPSLFAQLILARELYKGILLTQNTRQAFTLLNTLAMDDYPEALCDLGQFYEKGVGSKKDTKRAEELYESAMKLGIKRAKNHFKRIQEKKKGFFQR